MRRQVSLRRVVDVVILLLLVITAVRIVRVAPGAHAGASIATAPIPSLKSGDILRVPGVEWSAPRTVVLVLSSTCPACIANLPFYRQVAASATPEVQVVVLSQEPSTTISAWLRQNEMNATAIHTVANASSYGLPRTPMVLIVDTGGRITDLMIRKLDDFDQARVLRRIRDSGRTTPLDNSQRVREISVSELKATAARGSVNILDVRSRERFRYAHRSDAKNIPYPELHDRAPVELGRNVPVVVDCLQPGKTVAATCLAAAWMLVDAGFENVSALTR